MGTSCASEAIHAAACRSPSLKRADLAKQVVAVILDPIFSELIALEPAHDYDGPRCFASGRGNALPLLALGGAPGASLDTFVASKEEIVQGVGGFRKGVEKAGHRMSPGRDPMQAPVAEPVRHEIFRHVFVERLEIVASEHVLQIGTNRCITLKSHLSPLTDGRA